MNAGTDSFKNHAADIEFTPGGHWAVTFLTPLYGEYRARVVRWGTDNDILIIPGEQMVLFNLHEDAMMFFLAFA